MVALVEWFNLARRFGWAKRFASSAGLPSSADWPPPTGGTSSRKLCKTAISSPQPAESHCGIRAPLGLARVFQSFLNWFGWAEPEGMRVCPPLLMLAKLLLASIPLPLRPLADYSKRSWCQEEMATLFRSKPQARRPWRLMAPESIDSANRLIVSRTPSAKSRHSNLDLWIRMPDQWLEK
jgi:hypothetical protein